MKPRSGRRNQREREKIRGDRERKKGELRDRLERMPRSLFIIENDKSNRFSVSARAGGVEGGARENEHRRKSKSAFIRGTTSGCNASSSSTAQSSPFRAVLFNNNIPSPFCPVAAKEGSDTNKVKLVYDKDARTILHIVYRGDGMWERFSIVIGAFRMRIKPKRRPAAPTTLNIFLQCFRESICL